MRIFLLLSVLVGIAVLEYLMIASIFPDHPFRAYLTFSLLTITRGPMLGLILQFLINGDPNEKTKSR